MFDVARASTGKFVRSFANQQFVQDYAQRIDITRSRERLTPDLLGAGVIRSEHPELRLRNRRRYVGEIRINDLRDTEIQQLHIAGLRY